MATDYFAVHVEKVRGALHRCGLEGAILTRPEYGLYLAGRLGGPIVLGGSKVFRLDGVETLPWVRVLPSADLIHVNAAVYEAGLHGRAIGAETRFLSVASTQWFRDSPQIVDVEQELAAARIVKDVHELSVIRSHVRVLEDAFRTLATVTRPGMSEIDVALLATSSMSRALGRMIAFRGNLGSGRSCIDPDSQPSTRQLAQGDSFFLDLYPDLGGYFADLTRCFSIAEPDRGISNIHQVLENALTSAIQTVRAGIPAHAIDAAIRSVFSGAGYLPYFPHHAGHGMGLFATEPPFLVPNNDTVLPAGAVIAIEPGLYIPGVGSFRLEVDVIVTDRGCDVLGELPYQLLVCNSA